MRGEAITAKACERGLGMQDWALESINSVMQDIYGLLPGLPHGKPLRFPGVGAEPFEADVTFAVPYSLTAYVYRDIFNREWVFVAGVRPVATRVVFRVAGGALVKGAVEGEPGECGGFGLWRPHADVFSFLFMPSLLDHLRKHGYAVWAGSKKVERSLSELVKTAISVSRNVKSAGIGVAREILSKGEKYEALRAVIYCGRIPVQVLWTPGGVEVWSGLGSGHKKRCEEVLRVLRRKVLPAVQEFVLGHAIFHVARRYASL